MSALLKLNVFTLFLFLLITACTQSQKNTPFKSPAGYDLTKPQRFRMHEDLLEISGIAFNNGQPDTVYGIEDEDGRVYYSRLGDNEVKYTHFAKQGDYEDITLLNNRIYALKSNGTIFSFSLNEVNRDKPDNVTESKHILPKAEYEGMYADNQSGKIYVLCKNCGGKNKQELIGGYILQTVADSLKQTGSFTINAKTPLTGTDKKSDTFRPSGLAKNPVDKQWYIISASNNMLVITDEKWNVKDTYKLKGARFLQPEGIAFDKDGNMYISNEGDELSNANILKFVYNKASVNNGR
ncbi:SdiA-regulated domain-containing protein [Mucilaginibacter litoreus]|uniref:SdiA-regulated domain-containing protein n=1 Tax=Mucilaginibacter litoreus TaxID=1048221 RepID=A0ABW3ATM9_9SPHI